MRRFIISAACLCWATNTALGQWLFGPSNYEECMIAEMRGQAQSMQDIAAKLCARRHKKEVYVSASEIKYKWVSTQNLFVRIEVTDSGEYEITRMEAKFALKKCEETKVGDFTKEVFKGTFKGNKSDIFFGTAFSATEIPECMGSIRFWGIYK